MNNHSTSDGGRTRSALDALVRDGRTPGLQYLVVDQHQAVFEYVGGRADLRTRRHMTAEITMMAYPMSKTITAAAVLQLVEAQDIDLTHWLLIVESDLGLRRPVIGQDAVHMGL
jgi:CubicO group peptidase (beta-lactamase class C family)